MGMRGSAGRALGRTLCLALTLALFTSGCSDAGDSTTHQQNTSTAIATPIPHDGLRADAPARLTIGTAVSADADALADPGYQRALAENFSSVTPEVQMKWSVVEPERAQYDYSAADALVQMARANGQIVRGHTLLWYGALPEWVSGAITNCPDAKSVLQEHISNEVSHFRGQVAQWDVANEVLGNDGAPRQENPFIKACGLGIVADAFRWAHAADPNAKLYLNDYDQLTPGAKADAQYALVKSLVDQGVPINGVGFQAHETLTSIPQTAAGQLQRYASLGLDVAITEADVRIRATGNPSTESLRNQAMVYRQLVGLCLAQPRCTNFTVWGFSDQWSWVPGSLPGQGWACLLDASLDPKPAYIAVRQALLSDR